MSVETILETLRDLIISRLKCVADFKEIFEGAKKEDQDIPNPLRMKKAESSDANSLDGK